MEARPYNKSAALAVDKNETSFRIMNTEKVGGLTPLRIRKTCRTSGAGGWQAAKNL